MSLRPRSNLHLALRYFFYPTVGSLIFYLGQFLVVLPAFYFLLYASHLSPDAAKSVFSEPIPLAVTSLLCYSLTLFVLIFAESKILRRRATRSSSRTVAQNQKPSRTYFLSLFGLTELPTWTDIGLGLAGFVVSFLGALLVIYLCSLFPFFDPNEAQDVGFNASIAGFDRLFAFLTLVIIGPIAEELVFRGWIYGHLRQLTLSTPKKPINSSKASDTSAKTTQASSRPSLTFNLVLSIFLTSLAFAIMHGQLNVGVNVFVMSIVCCLLREFTGTIHAGIILHMVKNWLAFMLIYIFHII